MAKPSHRCQRVFVCAGRNDGGFKMQRKPRYGTRHVRFCLSSPWVLANSEKRFERGQMRDTQVVERVCVVGAELLKVGLEDLEVHKVAAIGLRVSMRSVPRNANVRALDELPCEEFCVVRLLGRRLDELFMELMLEGEVGVPPDEPVELPCCQAIAVQDREEECSVS